jgi:hypothetical protein
MNVSLIRLSLIVKLIKEFFYFKFVQILSLVEKLYSEREMLFIQPIHSENGNEDIIML